MSHATTSGTDSTPSAAGSHPTPGFHQASGGNPFRAILDVSAAIVSSLNVETVLENVAASMAAAMMVEEVDVETYDPCAESLTHRVHWSADAPAAARPDAAPVPLSERPALATVVHTGRVVEQRLGDHELARDDRVALAERGVKSVLSGPLAVGDQTLGLLSLVEQRFERHFTSIECDLFRQLCDIAAIGIHNADLYEMVDRKQRQLTSMVETSRAVSSSLVLDDVLAAITEHAAAALDVHDADIYEYDATADTMTWRASWPADWEYDEDAERPGTVYRLDEYGNPAAIREKKVLVESISDPDLHPSTRREFETHGEKVMVTVPLRFGDTILGTLEFGEKREERVFTDDEIELATALAEQAAVAIHNATMYRRQSEQTLRLTSLLEVNRALASHTDERVFPAIARRCALAFDAPRAVIYEYDDAHDTLTARGYFQYQEVPGYDTTGVAEPLDQTPANRTIMMGSEPVVEQIVDPSLDPTTRGEMEFWGEKTCLNAPIAFQEERLGILMLIWTDTAQRFDDQELDFAMGLGELAAIAIRNVRLAKAGGVARPEPKE